MAADITDGRALGGNPASFDHLADAALAHANAVIE
jgi:hypothetical protein